MVFRLVWMICKVLFVVFVENSHKMYKFDLLIKNLLSTCSFSDVKNVYNEKWFKLYQLIDWNIKLRKNLRFLVNFDTFLVQFVSNC